MAASDRGGNGWGTSAWAAFWKCPSRPRAVALRTEEPGGRRRLTDSALPGDGPGGADEKGDAAKKADVEVIVVVSNGEGDDDDDGGNDDSEADDEPEKNDLGEGEDDDDDKEEVVPPAKTEKAKGIPTDLKAAKEEKEKEMMKALMDVGAGRVPEPFPLVVKARTEPGCPGGAHFAC